MRGLEYKICGKIAKEVDPIGNGLLIALAQTCVYAYLPRVSVFNCHMH